MQPIADVYQAMPYRAPVPDRFFCETCWFLHDYDSADFRLWATNNGRDDLIDANAGCRCEMERQAKVMRIATNRTAANLPPNKTFDNFLDTGGSETMLQDAQEAVSGVGSPVRVWMGRPGSGKTHLMAAVGHAMIEGGISVRYVLAEDLVDKLRHTYQGSERQDLSDVVQDYTDCGILLIDDLGQQPATDWAKGQLTRIVDHRYSGGDMLIVVTNLETFDTMAEAWGERLASRLFDKYSGTVNRAWNSAGDYRREG